MKNIHFTTKSYFIPNSNHQPFSYPTPHPDIDISLSTRATLKLLRTTADFYALICILLSYIYRTLSSNLDREMIPWSVQRPVFDAYKMETQFSAMVFHPSHPKALFIVTAKDKDAAFTNLQTQNVAERLKPIIPLMPAGHPFSYLHVIMRDQDLLDAEVKTLKLDFVKHLLSSSQLLEQCPSASPPLVSFRNLDIQEFRAVTFMSITAVGISMSTSYETQKFFKILHGFDDTFSPIAGLMSSQSSPPVPVRALYNEIRTLLSLKPHRNIIPPPEALIIPDFPYGHIVVGCVYRYYPQGSLGQYLQTHFIQPISWILEWASDILAGISHLHSHGIHHGDIHIGNIIVGDDSILRLADFGDATPLSQMTSQYEFQDVPSAKRVLKYLFAKNPKEENPRDPVNLREDLPESVREALYEGATLGEMCWKIEEGRRVSHGKI